MARLQAFTQQHALERSVAPIKSSFVGGMSGSSEGVPKMHPLKSSMPVFKAANLIHMAKMPKIRAAKMPRMLKMGAGLRLPRV
jgi:hypothetical protein